MKKVYLSLLLCVAGVAGFAQSTTYSYSGSLAVYTVPAGVTGMAISATGAQGGGSGTNTGGLGANLSGSFMVTPGDVLFILVGQQGHYGYDNGGGGGGSFVYDTTSHTLLVAAGGGGGAGKGAGLDGVNASLTINGTDDGQSDGGGGVGGNGADTPASTTDDYGAGGAGWLSNGANGNNTLGYSDATGGADPMNGGVGGTHGGYGTSGNGGYGGGGGAQGAPYHTGGGGGGGYSGGAGGGGTLVVGGNANPGGGGGSYNGGYFQIDTVNNTGNGMVMLCPITGTVSPISGSLFICSFGSGSVTTLGDITAGGTGVWTSSDTTIAKVSLSGVVSGMSAGTVTIAYGVLSGCGYAFASAAVTVNPTPSVTPIPTLPALCNGSMYALVPFTSSVAGTYMWNNSNSTIGILGSGSGDSIAAFTLIDTSNAVYDSGVIQVTETTSAGCSNSTTFTIYVDPTPMLSTTLNPGAICNGSVFSYPAASNDADAALAWSRAVVAGISNPANSGGGNPFETLTDTFGNPNPENVVYNYIVTDVISGCADTENVNVTVNPTPMLSSTQTPAAVCDSNTFTYAPMSATLGTTFTWSRAMVTGIVNPAASGIDTIVEVLHDTTVNPVTVTYMDTLMANGCSNVEPVTLIVNPTPMLSSPLTIPAICDSSSIMYVATSATSGTSFSWTSDTVGSYNGTTGGDTISQSIINSGVLPIAVNYTFTMMANLCYHAEVVTVTVNPSPKFTSTLTPAGICDSMQFSYPPANSTPGSVFTWTRPFVLGLGLPAGTGTGNPGEYLKNNTNDVLQVNYDYIVSANGCSSGPYDVMVNVYPTPTFGTSLTSSVCSGSAVNYIGLGEVFGSTLSYTRASVSGITPATGSGSGPADADSVKITETLTNSTSGPIAVVYVFTLTANGCSNSQDLTVTVNPTPTALSITTHPSNSLCDNTMYQNFGVASVPPTGQNYHWEATNATIYAVGANNQYCLVNFTIPGSATVTMVSDYTGDMGCITNNSIGITVGSTSSDSPPVTYYEGQFLCLEPTEMSFQWGYDDATTLDSTALAGENNPNYINFSPDTANKYYWVITTDSGGCMQKTYWSANTPPALRNVGSGAFASLKVYPNPTSSQLNVEINTTMTGNFDLEVVNMLGQRMTSAVAQNLSATINVSALPAGVYLVNCYQDGAKLSAVRFVKN